MKKNQLEFWEKTDKIIKIKCSIDEINARPGYN